MISAIVGVSLSIARIINFLHNKRIMNYTISNNQETGKRSAFIAHKNPLMKTMYRKIIQRSDNDTLLKLSTGGPY